MRSLTHIGVLWVIVPLVFLALASLPGAASESTRPEWIDHPPQDPDQVVVVGISRPAVSEQAGRRASVQDGMRQLAESFGVTASVYFKGEAGRFGRETSDAIVSRSERVEIRGLVVDRIFVSDDHGMKTVYTLLRLPRAAYEAEKSRLESEAALLADWPGGFRRVAEQLAASQPKLSTIAVDEAKLAWSAEGAGHLATAAQSELATALARMARWKVVERSAPDTFKVRPLLSLTERGSLSLTVSLTQDGQLLWASQAVTIGSERLPDGLQAAFAEVVRREALGQKAAQTVVAFSVKLLGVNKYQYDRAWRALGVHSAVRSVVKTYYREGFGQLEVHVTGANEGHSDLCEVLEGCGLALIDRQGDSLVFKAH
jgi:hypothetical protein